MSRNVAAKNAEAESFSGLLERLSRQRRSGGVYPDMDPNLDPDLEREHLPGLDVEMHSRFGRDRYSGSASGPNPEKPTRILPAASVRAATAKSSGETAQLSYEQALRIHSRRAPQATAPLAPGTTAPAATSPKRTSSNPGGIGHDRYASSSESVTKPVRSAKSSPKQSLSEHQPTDAIGRAMQARSAARAALRLEQPMPPSPPLKSIPTPSEKRAPAQSQTPAKAKATSANVPAAASRHRERSVPTRKAVQRSAPALEITLSPVAALGLVDQDRRRAIVSIRLKEEEVERLRLRAAESGISVSAYMRSCVLEAEHLRAQVKAALAEMRGSVHAPIRIPEADRAAASLTTLSGIRNGGPVSGWSRLLWRSATFFLSPWFPPRPRT